MKIHLLSSASAVALLAATAGFGGQANATVLNGSFAVIPAISQTFTPNDITFSNFQLDGIVIGTPAGDFAAGGPAPSPFGTALDSSTYTAGGSGIIFNYGSTPQTINSFLSWTSGSDTYIYSVTGWNEATSAGNSGYLDTSGTLTDSLMTVSEAAVANFAFSQALVNGNTAVSGSGTFATGADIPPTPTPTPTPTPPTDSPEPASMALLGAGLLGLGVARRRPN